MKAKNTGNGIKVSQDGKIATVKCGQRAYRVRYEGKVKK